MTQDTGLKRDRNGRWVSGSKSGHCPNPHGRPLGARTRLSESFLKDMLADWEAHGAKAIATLRTERPHDYVKLVAGLLPRHFNIKVNELDELSDEQLDNRIATLLKALEEGTGDDADGEGQATPSQPPGDLPSLH